MFISKKKFDEAIAKAVEQARLENDRMHYEAREHEDIRGEIRELRGRVIELENKGKKRHYNCMHTIFPVR